MKVILRKEESGVSEVIGTILILAMTVVLFATIIVWVSSIPTPQASVRLEVDGTITPMYSGGVEVGATIALRHNGGESLDPTTTVIYITTKHGASTSTEILRTKGTHYNPAEAYGLIDGNDAFWNLGERWQLVNPRTGSGELILASTDTVTVTIVDNFKSLVLWTSQLTPPVGSRPPIMLDKWADSVPSTAAIDPVESGVYFYIFAKVTDPDSDLNTASVYATLTTYYGTVGPPGVCSLPQRMYDDGTHYDPTPGDGIFTLYQPFCMKFPALDWDGSIILFNATDRAGHSTSSRMVLHVIPGPPGGGTGQNGTGGTGRPQNLRWNGRQGYNIFNASQWDRFRYTAKETRTFLASEEVVVIIGSLDLENVFGTDQFTMWDPYSGSTPDAVVYGTNKAITQISQPSSTQAFLFLEFINGYYIYAYRFHMNDPATVGTNFQKAPLHPPNYYFARYSLDVLLTSSSGIRFDTTDSVNITDEDNYMRDFPQVQTYSDSGFSNSAQTFSSTAIVYVQVKMFTVDPVLTNVIFGNIVIKDYAGGTQLWRAPANGNDVNSPICTVGGVCTGSVDAITIVGAQKVYRFAINLSRADQDPWVEGPQNYALTVMSVRDTDEYYSQVSSQLTIIAPLYKLDILIGNDDTSSNAWGTHDYSYYYENVNGFDRWRKNRVEFCSGANCALRTIAVAFLDFDRDGDLDSVGSWVTSTTASQVVLYRRDLDSTGNVIFTRFLLHNLPTNVVCNSLATGDLTGDGAPEIVCGASNGNVWYYKNDGSFSTGSATKVDVDLTRTSAVNSVTIGDFNGDTCNDIAVGGASARLTWYPNLDCLGKFQNTGIVDNWFADGEQTIEGSVLGTYLNTFASDSVYEQVTEALVTEPVQTGSTTNAAFDSSASGWSYSDWETGAQASGTAQSTGGNPNAYVDVQMNFQATTTVSGYWSQSFTVTGSPPFTTSVQFDRNVSAFGGSSVTIYVFVDTTSGAPTVGTEVTAFTHTATSGWISSGSISVPSAKIPAPGTYYLKIAARTTNGAAGSQTIVRFDNARLSWSSTGGTASELEHYWRLTQLPNRAGTTFTFNLKGRHSANTEGDNFVLAYSSNVVGNDPTTGTYTTMLWVNATVSDQTYSYIMPSSVAGKIVFIRVLDMDRTVGNTVLDTLFVDQMYVQANTPSGTTGASLINPGDTTDVKTIDADDQDADGYADLAVGTAGGKIFKYAGSSGGLQTPAGALYTLTPANAIVGVKFGNISGTQTGLEIVFAFGTTVRVLTGSTGTVIYNALPTYSPANSITAFGVGDVNGDGWDDVAIGTSATKAAELWIWENLNNGLAWSNAFQIDNVGGAAASAGVYSLALGDASKSNYIGR